MIVEAETVEEGLAIAIEELRIACFRILSILLAVPNAACGLKILHNTKKITNTATGQINVFQVLDMICFTVITKPS